MIELLIEAGANLDIPDKHGFSALDYVSDYRDRDLHLILLDAGASYSRGPVRTDSFQLTGVD